MPGTRQASPDVGLPAPAIEPAPGAAATMHGRRIGRDSIALMAANLSTAVTQAVIGILAARTLPGDEFGRYAIGLGVAALCIAASDGGVGVIATRELAQGIVDPTRLVRLAFGVRMALAAMAVGLGMLGAPFLFGSQATVDAAQVGLLIGGLGAMSALGRSVFNGLAALRSEAVIQFVERGLLLVLSLAVLNHGIARDLLLVALVARAFGLAVRLLVILRQQALRVRLAPAIPVRRLLNASAPLGVAVVLATVYFQIDVLMLGVLVNEKSAGVYQAAVNILLLVYLVPESISVALVPAFSHAAVADRQRLARTLQAAVSDLSAAAIGAALVLVTLGPAIASVLYPDMPSAQLLLQVLAVACLFRFTSYALSALMPSIGRGSTRMAAAAAASVANVVLNLIFIPRFGALGAAAVTVTTEAVLLFAYLVSVPTALVPLNLPRIVSSIGFGMVLVGAAALVTSFTGLGIVGLAIAGAAWEVTALVRSRERPSRLGVRLIGRTVAAAMGWRS